MRVLTPRKPSPNMAQKTGDMLRYAFVLSVRAGRDQRAEVDVSPDMNYQRRVPFA
jgi:hypothetical protein